MGPAGVLDGGGMGVFRGRLRGVWVDPGAPLDPF